MTYTFKLSRRLAIVLSIAATTGSVACSAGTPVDPSGAADTAVPTLTPKNATLVPGGTVTFTSTAGTDTATFWASGGTVTTSGTYTAPAAAGTYRIIARWPKHGHSDSATVVVVNTQVPAPSPTPTAPTLSSLVLTPDSLYLEQTDSFPIEPVGRTTAGDSVRPAVSWLATGGTIESSGMFLAGTKAGDYTVTARSANGLLATTIVRVAPAITAIVVTPSSVSLRPGETQQFTARGVTVVGDTVAIDVVWSATGGTITTGGLFTAGTTGTYSIVATLAPPTWDGSPIVFSSRMRSMPSLSLQSRRTARPPVEAWIPVTVMAQGS